MICNVEVFWYFFVPKGFLHFIFLQNAKVLQNLLMNILFFTPIISSRLEYTINIIFKLLLNIDCNITTSMHDFCLSECLKINYSSHRITQKEVFIFAHSILFEKNIRPQLLVPHKYKGLFAIFHTNHPDSDLPFDLFAMVFYLISRYEEYLPYTSDTHGRFTANQSIAYQYHFLKYPVVNQWIMQLKQILEKKSNLDFPKVTSSFSYLPTYDIDMAWAYRHRNWQRTIGAYLQDILLQRWVFLSERFKVQYGKKLDPFDTFDFLNDWHQTFPYQPFYFFLLGNHGKYDKNIHPQHPAFRQLIIQLHKRYQIGIHPSYQSNISIHQLSNEIKQLENIVGTKIRKSRQHFLKLHLPQTYQNLLELGITEDYSMGYAEDIGFRASIATPYQWYDLKKEQETNLMIYPFQIMDVTLKQYLKLSPIEALDYIKPLISITKEVNGTLSTIWHNSSFSTTHGWEGWNNLYQQMWRVIESPQE